MKDGLCSCCDFTVRCHMIPPYVAWAQVKSGKQTECQGKSHIIATLSFHITWPFNHSYFLLLANSHIFTLLLSILIYIHTHYLHSRMKNRILLHYTWKRFVLQYVYDLWVATRVTQHRALKLHQVCWSHILTSLLCHLRETDKQIVPALRLCYRYRGGINCIFTYIGIKKMYFMLEMIMYLWQINKVIGGQDTIDFIR